MSEEQEIRSLLSLLCLPGVGPGTVRKLLDVAGTAVAALRLDPELLRGLGLQAEVVASIIGLGGRPAPRSASILDAVRHESIDIVTFASTNYPALLRHVACPPPLLFVKGAVVTLATPQVAIVGSRDATVAGVELAHGIAGELTQYGLTITSGLAYGIDAAAHRGAVAAGGRTVAVLGCGVDHVYPAAHRRLARELVASGGALVSEFLPGVRPEPANFPRRNRIISGISLGVLVVEAALKSGSLLTARHALEQDREVMAVPGPVRSRQSRGCHELLRNGAALVESAADVVQALGDRFRPLPMTTPELAPDGEEVLARLDAGARQVLLATGHVPTPADLIAARCGLSAAACRATLVALELQGLIASSDAGFARLC